MPSREEILKALQTIKSVCEQHEKCDTCPLQIADQDYYDNYGCAMQRNENPSDWKIKEPETVWRAFEDS